MPPYHASTSSDGCKLIGNVPLLPLRLTAKGTSSRGPAPIPARPDQPDIVDESLDLFKANILFTTYEVRSNTLIIQMSFQFKEMLFIDRLRRRLI